MSNLNVSSGHFVGNDGLPVNWEVDVTPLYEWPSFGGAIDRATKPVEYSQNFRLNEPTGTL